jgi:ATP-dependent DNA helicase RecQ
VGRFSDELVYEAAAFIRDHWRRRPPLTWVSAIPSLRRPDLVPDFGRRLARILRLPYHGVLVRVRDVPGQKEMQNSVPQARNVWAALRVRGRCPAGPVLLVDDIVDSRWTLTVAGYLLRQAGVAAVLPFALAVAATASGDLT